MATGNIDDCLKVTLSHEGGYVDHPRDPGGATNLGITHKTLAAWRGVASVTKAQVKALRLDEATAIYRERYWKPLKCDSLPVGVDLATLDLGVNSGIDRSARYLQAVVGVPVDGKIGTKTLKAVIEADTVSVIKRLCAKRLGFLQTLKTWATFKRGWSRRVADVEAKSVAMYLAWVGLPAAGRAKELGKEADKAAKTATQQRAGAGTAASGGVAVGGGDAVVTGAPNWTTIAVVAGVVLVVSAVLLIKAYRNRERTEAYRLAAA